MTDQRLVGRTYESQAFEVTEASIRAYMDAVGDGASGGLLEAPPTYAMVYGYDAYWQLWSDQEVAMDVAHLVHGDQRFIFHRPVRPGDRIRTTGRLANVTVRGDLELVTFEANARDAQDRPVSESTSLFIIRKP
ncbi:MAG: MaoC family dehydratase N-terminal domain-containing protein [Candidatus Dormibacteraeota bacterium]|nr:MaoC family dehydratase N-terminal domain-containing protein [Candidatus Dormibacteraeota bacterium]